MLGYLHGHQTVVDSLLFHQLFVRPQLHNLTIMETTDDVGILDGGEAVGDHDGGATHTDLRARANPQLVVGLGSIVVGFWTLCMTW